MIKQTLLFSSLSIGSCLGLFACSNDSDKLTYAPPDPIMVTYRYHITVNNLTAAQPLSPIAAVLHKQGYTPYTLGMPASIGLEVLAESGANSTFIAEANLHSQVVKTESGSGIIPPSAMEVINIESTMEKSDSMPKLQLSLASMLVNSNDAITALNGLDLSKLESGATLTVMLGSYDAGTEANSETDDTIPGPAAAGGNQEAYNVERDDIMDAVLTHSGVVTKDDGLATSTLSAMHKWDNPVAHIMITRTQ